MKSIILIIILIIIGSYLYNKFQKASMWTLMVCSIKMDNGVECLENSYEIPGFKSQKECMLEGASQFSEEGFECGRNCRKDYGANVCSEVCNKTGCSK